MPQMSNSKYLRPLHLNKSVSFRYASAKFHLHLKKASLCFPAMTNGSHPTVSQYISSYMRDAQLF